MIGTTHMHSQTNQSNAYCLEGCAENHVHTFLTMSYCKEGCLLRHMHRFAPTLTAQTTAATHTHLMSSSNAAIIERTYEQAPTVIRHEEKAVYETHTVPTIIDKNILPTKIEAHMAQPIIKEHHRDVIHEHHQNIIHEHHKNIVHE